MVNVHVVRGLIVTYTAWICRHRWGDRASQSDYLPSIARHHPSLSGSSLTKPHSGTISHLVLLPSPQDGTTRDGDTREPGGTRAIEKELRKFPKLGELRDTPPRTKKLHSEAERKRDSVDGIRHTHTRNLSLAGRVRAVNGRMRPNPREDASRRFEDRWRERGALPRNENEARGEGYIGCIRLSIPYFPRSANRKMELARPEDSTKAGYWPPLLRLQTFRRDTNRPPSPSFVIRRRLLRFTSLNTVRSRIAAAILIATNWRRAREWEDDRISHDSLPLSRRVIDSGARTEGRTDEGCLRDATINY